MAKPRSSYPIISKIEKASCISAVSTSLGEILAIVYACLAATLAEPFEKISVTVLLKLAEFVCWPIPLIKTGINSLFFILDITLDLKKPSFSSAISRMEELPSQIEQHSNNFKGSTRTLELNTCSRFTDLCLLKAFLLSLAFR